MSKFFKENGFFTREGEEFFKSYFEELEKIFSSEEVSKMKVSEVRAMEHRLLHAIKEEVSSLLIK